MPDSWVLGVLSLLGIAVALYPLRRKKKHLFFVLPLSVIFLILGYGVWGGWFEWRAFNLSEQEKLEAKEVLQKLGNTDAIIQRLKTHLAETPKDAKAWFLLGRVYAAEGDWKHANEAYTIAHGIAPNHHEYSLHYAQSLWELSAFNDETRILLQDILKQNPNQADALAMLGYDAYAQHRKLDALVYWERLLQLTEASSEEAKKLRQAIAKVRQELKGNAHNLKV